MSAGSRRFAQPGGVFNATPPRVVFGDGAAAGLRDEVAALDAGRALVVTTPGRVALGDAMATLIGDRCAGLLPEAVSQVPIELAWRGRDKALSAGADCLVAVGGGAATGLCKGIAYNTELPIIAVPTTYSGSEMTGFCGMTIGGVKRMHESLAMRPATVVYDPQLSRGLPVATSAASVMNALAHCVDAIYLPTLSPLLTPAAVTGARVLAAALPRLLAAPDDIGVRSDLLYGSYLAGAALTGGFALQHAIAHMLGGSFDVEHGVAHAVVLPYVAAHLEQVAPQPLARIADAVGADDGLAGFLWDLARLAGLPRRLAEVGLDPAELDRAVRIATTAEEHDDPRMAGNPAPVTEEVVRAVLTAAATGERPGATR